jgi:hypothetical protein
MLPVRFVFLWLVTLTTATIKSLSDFFFCLFSDSHSGSTTFCQPSAPYFAAAIFVA